MWKCLTVIKVGGTWWGCVVAFMNLVDRNVKTYFRRDMLLSLIKTTSVKNKAESCITSA